ncbi:cupin domain-containing protein [Promethearchaeum syntrophicum]|uniref:Cupin domain-containing protein n=1 Tax=Promethearchaeum syntrophicum TaxID=2594042 RepID=A0A5B9D8S1_9ARCH|nr:cupin domain-containing protein [Candidatus Prometheoarchaeum syntrophicum]QEE15170.1 Cupin domain protein [Candidatus Prometheoarchaeum syntrophicum]
MKIIFEDKLIDDNGVKYMNRGPDIDWGLITLQPGQEKPPHYHEKMGETFYITEGTMTFVLKDKEFNAPKGTAIRLEAFETHGLKNKTDSQAKLLFIKERYLPKDKVNCD